MKTRFLNQAKGTRLACILFLMLGFAATSVQALGPHEILLLINSDSEDSVAVATEFIRLRGVPPKNVIRLALGAKPPLAYSVDDFTAKIWEPASRYVAEHELTSQTLAWIYAPGFPTTINTTTPISITGMTFLRNRPLPAESVDKGKYMSPLFSCGHYPPDRTPSSRTLDVFKKHLGEDMPLPAMMLGCITSNGNTRQEVIACLARGKESDSTCPTGTVYFLKGNDVRSTCREWQFPNIVSELTARNVNAAIQTDIYEARPGIIGFLAGMPSLAPARLGSFLPGAVAEHLTSMAGMFNYADQTKLSAWISAGATASAGTVSEPYSIWMKFPHAGFFVHYSAGCTLIESFYQSVACPLQILAVGDPLAQPWAPPAQLVLNGLPPGTTLSSPTNVLAEVRAPRMEKYLRRLFLLDGKPAGTDQELLLDPSQLAPGPHTLRAVAFRTGLVRCQVFAEQSFVVPKPASK